MSNILDRLESCPDDEGQISLVLWDLYYAMHMRKVQYSNVSQRVFYVAYEAIVLASSDGLEMLIEQDTSLEDYADSLDRVGLPQLVPVFNGVIALLPTELRDRANEPALLAYTRTIFKPLQELLDDFFDASKNACATMRYFILNRRSDFSEFAD